MPEHTRLRLKCVKFRGKQVHPLRFGRNDGVMDYFVGKVRGG